MIEQCSNCKFFKAYEGQTAEFGYCRRYAPKPQSRDQDNISGLLGPIAQVALNKLVDDERWQGWSQAIEDSGDSGYGGTAFRVQWPEVFCEDFCGEFKSSKDGGSTYRVGRAKL